MVFIEKCLARFEQVELSEETLSITGDAPVDDGDYTDFVRGPSDRQSNPEPTFLVWTPQAGGTN